MTQKTQIQGSSAEYRLNEKLAETIKEYWRGLGHLVKTQVTYDEKSKTYGVAILDFKNGLPNGRLTPECLKKLRY